MITYTDPNTSSDLVFTPLDKPVAEGGVAVPVDGNPAIVISAELAPLLTYTVDPAGSGFNGKLAVGADIGTTVLTGTVTATVDPDLSENTAQIVAVLTVTINPFSQATILDFTATDPVAV